MLEVLRKVDAQAAVEIEDDGSPTLIYEIEATDSREAYRLAAGLSGEAHLAAGLELPNDSILHSQVELVE